MNLYSEDSISSINKLINNNLNFSQIIDSGLDEINSKGRLVRNKDFIEITIDFPTKEKYILRDSIIEIYDYEFNQSQIIEINDDNSFLFNFLDFSFLGSGFFGSGFFRSGFDEAFGFFGSGFFASGFGFTAVGFGFALGFFGFFTC